MPTVTNHLSVLGMLPHPDPGQCHQPLRALLHPLPPTHSGGSTDPRPSKFTSQEGFQQGCWLGVIFFKIINIFPHIFRSLNINPCRTPFLRCLICIKTFSSVHVHVHSSQLHSRVWQGPESSGLLLSFTSSGESDSLESP